MCKQKAACNASRLIISEQHIQNNIKEKLTIFQNIIKDAENCIKNIWNIVARFNGSVTGKNSVVIVNTVMVNGKWIDKRRNNCKKKIFNGSYTAENLCCKLSYICNKWICSEVLEYFVCRLEENFIGKICKVVTKNKSNKTKEDCDFGWRRIN